MSAGAQIGSAPHLGSRIHRTHLRVVRRWTQPPLRRNRDRLDPDRPVRAGVRVVGRRYERLAIEPSTWHIAVEEPNGVDTAGPPR